MLNYVVFFILLVEQVIQNGFSIFLKILKNDRDTHIRRPYQTFPTIQLIIVNYPTFCQNQNKKKKLLCLSAHILEHEKFYL